VLAAAAQVRQQVRGNGCGCSRVEDQRALKAVAPQKVLRVWDVVTDLAALVRVSEHGL
jgi:hypothetical protein